MRITVGMHEAKTNFSRLVRQANDGDDVVVDVPWTVAAAVQLGARHCLASAVAP